MKKIKIGKIETCFIFGFTDEFPCVEGELIIFTTGIAIFSFFVGIEIAYRK